MRRSQGEFDAETMHFGLAVTGSQESYIGIGGMTPGGGLGRLGRYRGCWWAICQG